MTFVKAVSELRERTELTRVKGSSAIRRNHTTSWVAIFDFWKYADMNLASRLPISPGLPIFPPNLYTDLQGMYAIPIFLYR